MSDLTQFSGTSGKDACDVVIGFDFGTSCSKVVLRTPDFYAGRAFAIPFEKAGHESSRCLLPSVLWIDKDGRLSLTRFNESVLLRDIKYHLMNNEPVAAVNGPSSGARIDSKVVAVGFLALALREARAWFLKNQKTLYGKLDLRWTFNIGLPSADFADQSLCSAYEKVAKAAWALSVRKGELHLQTVTEVIDSPENWDQLNEREEAEIKTIPEVAAEVAGYAKSSLRDDGLHILVDIGATTLDVCSFTLYSTAEIENCYGLLTTDVDELGASILYWERVSAVRRAVNEHVEKLWNQYDPVSPMEDRVERYSPNHDSVAKFIKQYDHNYERDCKKVLSKTMVALKTSLDPNSARWKATMPLFLSGGGSFMPFYRSFIEQTSRDIARLYKPFQGFQMVSLPKPENLVGAVDQQNYQRFAVAWGLSYRETDIGTPERPSKEDVVAPRQRYDWGGREFISKDMV